MSGSARVLIIGGGISGITAAVEASEAGAEVLVVEKTPFLGGRVSQLNLYFPKLCPPACGLELNLRRFRASPKIRCRTLAEVESIRGGPGNFEVSIVQHPRFVNNLCTGCRACAEVCPVPRDDDFNLGLSQNKAAYLSFPSAFPLQYVIDRTVCPGEECGLCLKACKINAIDLTMEEERITETFDSVIVATGWKPYDATKLTNLGYGRFPNVVTNLELERLASIEGPEKGRIQRLSDGHEIRSVAFVQCAGSRDENHLRHCSGVCCLASLKQTRYIRERYPDSEIFIFYIDIRSPGRLEDFYSEISKDEKTFLIKGKVAKVEPADSSGLMMVQAEDVLAGKIIRKSVDLVVLATGMVPTAPSLDWDLVKDDHGFLPSTSAKGIYPAGCVRRPVDVAEAVRDATSAVMRSIQVAKG